MRSVPPLIRRLMDTTRMRGIIMDVKVTMLVVKVKGVELYAPPPAKAFAVHSVRLRTRLHVLLATHMSEPSFVVT